MYIYTYSILHIYNGTLVVGGGLIAKSCLTLVTPWLLSPWDFPGKNTESCCFLLQQWNIAAAAAAAKSLQSCPTVRPHRQQPTRLP